MAWHPDEGQLKQLVGYLRDSLSGHDQNAQKYATIVSIASLFKPIPFSNDRFYISSMTDVAEPDAYAS